MKTDHDRKLKFETIPSLQQELNEFVMQTEQRLQALAGTLSANRGSKQVVATPEPTIAKATEQPLVLSLEADINVPEPAVSTYEHTSTNPVATEVDHTDPLSRLNAIKQRLAARIDQHDASN